MSNKVFSLRDHVSVEVFAPENLTAGTTYYTEAFNTARCDVASLQLVFADSITMNVALETSNHPDATASGSAQDPVSYPPGHGEPEYWFEHDLASVSGTTGVLATGSIMYDIGNFGGTYARLKMEPTTSGTVSVYGTAKNHTP